MYSVSTVAEASFHEFFARHFSATVDSKAALGAVRKFDPKIGEILDLETWDIPIEAVPEIREALQAAERRVKLLR